MNYTCDPAEIAHIEREIARNPNNLGVGVLDLGSGQVRLFSFDETDRFSQANPLLQVMAGHEAAAAMAGFPHNQARGFVLAKTGNDWFVVNSSHLNQPDAQPNAMQMVPQTFGEVLAALKQAGIPNPIVP